MIVPKHLHHVKPSSGTIIAAQKSIQERRKIEAIRLILNDPLNERKIRNDGVVESQNWGLKDSKDYVEQVLMVEEKGNDK